MKKIKEFLLKIKKSDFLQTYKEEIIATLFEGARAADKSGKKE